jgi:hypothetical protein
MLIREWGALPREGSPKKCVDSRFLTGLISACRNEQRFILSSGD